MSAAVGFRTYMPRRAPGLPPGQRELTVMPRFSDKPLRWAPVVGPISLTISIEGQGLADLDGSDLERFPSVDQTSDFHCVTTWTVRGLRWSGVRLTEVIWSVFTEQELPPYAVVSAADERQAIFATEDLLEADVLLATHLNGAPLPRRHGAPLRLVSPSQYGYKSAKHLTGIEFVNDEPISELGAKEHLRARVAREERHAKLPNWLLRVPYRLTVPPTALAAERGLRNSPQN